LENETHHFVHHAQLDKASTETEVQTAAQQKANQSGTPYDPVEPIDKTGEIHQKSFPK
jgi:hypothetical protein